MSQAECLYSFFTQQNVLHFLKHIDVLRDSSKMDFYSPVLENPQLREVHDAYKQIIQQPTSLKRIKEKCFSSENYYPLIGHFLSDLKLLVNNALLFNKEELRPDIIKFEEKIIEVFPLYSQLKDDFKPYGQITIPPAFLQMLAGRMMVHNPIPALKKSDIKIDDCVDLKLLSQKKFWTFSKLLFEFEDEKLDFSVYKDVKSARTTYPSSVSSSIQAPSKSFEDIMRSRLEQERLNESSSMKVDESIRTREEATPILEMSPLQASSTKADSQPVSATQSVGALSFAEIMRLRKLKEEQEEQKVQ